MRKFTMSIFVICLYCFPFGYVSMYQDWANTSMIGYLIMIAGTSILAVSSRVFSNIIPFIIGNLASAMISLYFLHRMDITLGAGWDHGYFKPFAPHQVLLLISCLNLLPQLLVMWLTNRKKEPVR
ncbi:hypothetical protein [Priestia koreensis]|uniref:hypothetical protein n=1 Tax=Priestia koreensis TaxID=284581 RepID=UPI00203CF56C|nr:hypothetical protein [Priestia koreensis]MCM3006150.1 hypothetical protein [Priestia koreensis]